MGKLKIRRGRKRQACQYCNSQLTKSVPGRPKPNDGTRDHIFPRKHKERRRDPLNVVIVCRRCNERKKDLPPLHWLMVMPPFGVIWFIRRLKKLGVPAEEIRAAEIARGEG